jgi:hypothetical protein
MFMNLSLVESISPGVFFGISIIKSESGKDIGIYSSLKLELKKMLELIPMIKNNIVRDIQIIIRKVSFDINSYI